MNKFFRWFYFKILKWKLIGEIPKIEKMILPVIPHTHWNDFFMGIIIRNVIDEKINFVGKKEIFGPLTGWFFKIMGGTSVERNSKSNTVNSIVDIFKTRRVFRLALSPEGTRKKVKDWKTGFYHIAKLANVPICLVSFDYGKKQIVFHKLFYTTNNMKKDMSFLKGQFKGVVGRIPKYSWVYEDNFN
jgi:1-acyl-sn-glycerol-3-phosphate acyltransferase